MGPQLQAAVAPPFPISASSEHDDLSALRAHIAKPVTVGVILLRLGYYAIGVANDGALVVTKSGSPIRAGQASCRRAIGEQVQTQSREVDTRVFRRGVRSGENPLRTGARGLSTGLRWAATGRCWHDS